MSTGSYARPDLLAEPDWLWEHRDDPDVRIVDCARTDAYQRAHVPGAVSLDQGPARKTVALGATQPGWIKEPDGVSLMGPEPFAELMALLGVSEGTTVVAYDGMGSMWATRLWWALAYYGHDRCKVLNGGWHRWLAEGRPVTLKPTTAPPGSFTPRPRPELEIGLGELKERLADPTLQVLDVRGRKEYTGADPHPYGNARVGHIPGALHRDWADFMTADDRRVFKPAAELEALLAESGLRPGGEVAAHCQAAIRGAHAAFVMTLLGREGVRLYDASMKEWANRDDTPLVVGER